MLLSKLVEKHGLRVRVSCNKYGYPPFTVAEQRNSQEFLCKYDEGTTFVFVEVPWIDDYELVPDSPGGG